MRALVFACRARVRTRTVTSCVKKEPWITRRWITTPKVLTDDFDDEFPLATLSLEEDVDQIEREMDDSKWMSFQAEKKWLDRVITPAVRLAQDTTQRALRQSIYTGDMHQVENAYIEFRDSSINLKSETAVDSAHSGLFAVPSTRVQSLLVAREELSLYSTRPANRIKAAIDQDLHHVWLPMMNCNSHNDLAHVVKRLARLNYLEDAAATLTRYARGEGVSSNPELLRQAAVANNMWKTIFGWHLLRKSSPEAISKLLLHATGLGLPVDRVVCAHIIRYYLRCQPHPHEELATCFDLMSDSQVEFEEHGLKLLWMLKTGSKADIDGLVRIIKQSGGLDSLHPATLNGLVIYEARRGNWQHVQRYLERIRSKAFLIEYDALLGLAGFPELDLAHSPTTIATRDGDRGHSRSPLIWWLKVQQSLQSTEFGLEDRIKEAVAICSTAQEYLEPLETISLLPPVLSHILREGHANDPMVDQSTGKIAFITKIYDNLVWPDPRTVRRRQQLLPVFRTIKRLLQLFLDDGDVNRFTLLCIQASIFQFQLRSTRLYGFFTQIMKRRPSWEEAATYYEQLQLLQSDGEVYACLRDILHIPGNSAQPYPSAKFFGRLVKNCNYDQKRRLMKILLRRYLDFVRTNVAFEYQEKIPGHKAAIGAQVRSLHAMVPEEPGWDDLVERQCRTLLMTAYFYTDQFDEAVAIWKGFGEDRQDESHTIASFIDGCGRHYKVQIAEEVWDAMRARRQPTANVLGARLECLCRHSKASFERARDIFLFDMGAGGGLPAADLGCARIILSFAPRYKALEDTKVMIKTHLPDIWMQIRETLSERTVSSNRPKRALFLGATVDTSNLNRPVVHKPQRQRSS
ncbi:hypothetical protein CALVIDRAFT_567632 [Calocera viscosa TUFC12733]|uniref:Uncharacterized protein n=1 Tax=Calocera viscosa (strain TUFC12733) TaxID=1330018 RepID=A0A167HW82_CALVF|nr:hypothetical protein CALVIDRAFT_567632 [Calocera viscosa TUFC12733]